MIPADLEVELAAAISELVAAGHLPGSAVGLSAAGTWRPAPASPALVSPASPAPASPAPASPAPASPAPVSPAPAGAARRTAASYATPLPFELARLTGEEPAAVAARLAQVIQRAGWITSAEATGAGYLTIGVTTAALAAVAVRISQAGSACVSSEALRGIGRPAPPWPDLAAATTWRQAWRDQAAALAGRLAVAAGATALQPGAGLPAGQVSASDAPAGAFATGPSATGPSATGPSATGPSAGDAALAGAIVGDELMAGPPGGGGTPGGGGAPGRGATVAEAVAYAGVDAVRYWLARMPAVRAGGLDRPVSLARDPARPRTAPLHSAPLYAAPPGLARDLAAVAFARADAGAAARWAAELGLARREPLGAGQLAQPAEIMLLTQLSWLAERVAGAARRRQPAELPHYLERLAEAWLDVRESCPALPFGGRDAPGDAAGISARLWLAQATATALEAGLDLAGVRL